MENSLETKKVYKEIGFSRYLYWNKLDKACFQQDMAYGGLMVYLEEQLLLKKYEIKRLILQKIQNMMDIKEDLLK